MDVFERNNRIVYLDYLKVVATISVIIVHCVASKWYSVDYNSYHWLVFNFYDSAAHWGVPVFLMISGALFLNKKELSVKRIYKKNILRLFVAYFVWSFIYFIFRDLTPYSQIQKLLSYGKSKWFLDIIYGNYHLWFIPMLIGLYMCIPVFKEVIKNENVTRYFLLISFLSFCFLPWIVQLGCDFLKEKYIFPFKIINIFLGKLDIKLFANYSLYFVLGYYLSNISITFKKQLFIYMFGIIGFVLTFFLEMLLTNMYQKPIENYFGYSNLNIFLMAVAIFIAFKNISFNNIKLNCFIKIMSKWSFGAYLIHALVIDKLSSYGVDVLILTNTIISTPVFAIIVAIVSFGTSALINQIPFLNKYIV